MRWENANTITMLTFVDVPKIDNRKTEDSLSNSRTPELPKFCGTGHAVRHSIILCVSDCIWIGIIWEIDANHESKQKEMKQMKWSEGWL